MILNPTAYVAAPAPAIGVKVNPGVVCMIGAMLLLPIGDSFAKTLTGAMNPVSVTMWRFLAQGLLLIPVACLMRRRLRGAMFSPVVALSGGLLAISLSCLIYAFSMMPIATAIAIFFVEPLILTLLAGPLLGETAGPRRLTAVGVGLIGAMLVIRPGFGEFGWATALPLVSAFAYALNMIVLKRASAKRSALTVQCGATVYAAAILMTLVGAMALAGAPDLAPGPGELWAWGAILCAGAAGAVSFVLIAEAFRAADATSLAPLQYLEIIGATALGFIVFGDSPDALTWAGVAVILGSGVYIFHREGRAETAAPRRRRGGR